MQTNIIGRLVGIWVCDTWVDNGVVVGISGDWVDIVHNGQRGVWQYPIEQIGEPVYAS